MQLILASQSPRRRELFELIGLPFTAVTSDADEDIPSFTSPGSFVEQLALRKAQAVYATHPGCCVVGADTIVWLDDEIIGKPTNREDAYRILRRLSGRTHTVYTGLAVRTDAGAEVIHDTTLVTFAALSDDEIWHYIDSGEPMDKAGAYGVQGLGAIFVQRVEGCYFTVIGMPVPILYQMLKRAGIRPKDM
ncbi:MAG: Maf family protein [Christensenellaceae bacterium]|jgi:septum formation protein|nr:Maf family protein [Christensenellaceae bacterium]